MGTETKPMPTKGAVAKNALILIFTGGVTFNIGIFLTALIITAIIGIPMAIIGAIMMIMGGISLILLPLHNPNKTTQEQRDDTRKAVEGMMRKLKYKLPTKLQWMINA